MEKVPIALVPFTANMASMFRAACFAFIGFFPGAIFGLAAEKIDPPRLGENHTIPELALALVWIAPGTFFMSNPFGTDDDTWVTFTRGYWLGRTEVTQTQWQAVARHIPVYENTPLPSSFKGSERPVENVSWDMAVLFCAKLNELERAAGRLPPGYEYCLPTEAQWEYACRAGTTGKYAGDLAAMAWYDANSGGTTHPVAQKKPNAWGLYDMHGNVNEWCADWYGGYPGGKAEDPTGPASGVYRVRRGGSFVGAAGSCRSAIRNHWRPELARYHMGFRLALAPVRNVPAAAVRDPTPAKPHDVRGPGAALGPPRTTDAQQPAATS
ncbi:MAG: formylglycine-generating enzyme family protein [Verrucomicrobia bacterium]|nr:formylglycine-generating enzyme family protein [Verrucomicrobiota bacterium]